MAKRITNPNAVVETALREIAEQRADTAAALSRVDAIEAQIAELQHEAHTLRMVGETQALLTRSIIAQYYQRLAALATERGVTQLSVLLAVLRLQEALGEIDAETSEILATHVPQLFDVTRGTPVILRGYAAVSFPWAGGYIASPPGITFLQNGRNGWYIRIPVTQGEATPWPIMVSLGDFKDGLEAVLRDKGLFIGEDRIRSTFVTVRSENKGALPSELIEQIRTALAHSGLPTAVQWEIMGT